MRLRLIRRCLPFAVPAVLGLNLFAVAALYMAPRKPLPPMVKKGLIAPYDSWKNRIATLAFVQDIPLYPGDPSYALVEQTARGLHRLAHLPMLLLWGRHDFVFDMTYYDLWRRYFPRADSRVFDSAGHYLFEDEPEVTLDLIRRFITREAPSV